MNKVTLSYTNGETVEFSPQGWSLDMFPGWLVLFYEGPEPKRIYLQLEHVLSIETPPVFKTAEQIEESITDLQRQLREINEQEAAQASLPEDNLEV